MTLLLKDPEAALDYAVDWRAQYLGEDSIVESEWEAIPAEDGGVVVLSSNFDGSITTVKAGGGIPGRIYRLANRITLASGLTDNRSIVLRVEQR